MGGNDTLYRQRERQDTGQRPIRMERVVLNNCWEDPTFMRKKPHLDYCQAAGIPSPRGNLYKAVDALLGGPVSDFATRSSHFACWPVAVSCLRCT